MKEGPWAVQPNRKMESAGSKGTLITFGFGFIHVVCGRGLQLDYTALVILVLLGEGQLIQFVYIFGFLTAYIQF